MMPDQALCSLPEGTPLQEFEILAVLGGGKNCFVYKAYDHGLDRLVAIKEYLPAGIASRSGFSALKIPPDKREQFTQGIERFSAEAQNMAKFRDPVFREALRLINENGTAYIIMAYYEGKTLRKMLHEEWRAKDIGELLSIILPILIGIFSLHKESYCHCGISPNNVLLRDNSTPILLDFSGVQCQGEMAKNRCLTELFPGFAAKEQYEEGSKMGAWTDIYAISALSYYVITGIIPDPSFSRGTYDSLKPLTSFIVPDFSSTVLEVIDKGMAVEPQDRFESIGVFVRAFEDATKKAILKSDKQIAHKMMSVDTVISSFSSQQREILQFASKLRDQL